MMFANQPAPSLFGLAAQPQQQPRRQAPYVMGEVAQGGASMAPAGSPTAAYAQGATGIVNGIFGRLQDDARGGVVNRPLDDLVKALLRPADPQPDPLAGVSFGPTFADAPMPTIDLSGTSWT